MDVEFYDFAWLGRVVVGSNSEALLVFHSVRLLRRNEFQFLSDGVSTYRIHRDWEV